MATTTGVFVRIMACGILAALLLTGFATEAQTTRKATTRPTVEHKREQKIIRAAGVDKWPKSDRLTLAPAIDRSWLSNPDLVTFENQSYDLDMVDNVDCGSLDLEWRNIADAPEPEPTELTPEHQEWFDQWMKRDPVPEAERKKRYERELEDYRRDTRSPVKGTLRVRIFLASSAREAQEQLVRSNSMGNAPDELYIGRFHDELKVANLGDVAFKWSSPRGVPYAEVMMARGNVAVTIEGRGLFAGEVETLAAKIDAAILKEPAVTDWNTVRPSVTIGSEAERRVMPSGSMINMLPVTVTAPAGQKVVRIEATVNGKRVEAPMRDNAVWLSSHTGQLKIKARVVTDRLIVSDAATADVFVEDVKEK